MEPGQHISNEQLIGALKPFAEIGAWLFARKLPDDTPVVEITGLNGAAGCLTRGDFKAAFSAMRGLEGTQADEEVPQGALAGMSPAQVVRNLVDAELRQSVQEALAWRNKGELVGQSLHEVAQRLVADAGVDELNATRMADTLVIEEAAARFAGRGKKGNEAWLNKPSKST